MNKTNSLSGLYILFLMTRNISIWTGSNVGSVINYEWCSEIVMYIHVVSDALPSHIKKKTATQSIGVYVRSKFNRTYQHMVPIKI